jgi:hypothetical protein
MVRRNAFLVAATAVAALAPPRTLGAQSGTSTLIAGVADAATGAPLEGAEILFVKLHRLGRANTMGEATVNGVPRGAQRVRVRRLGYAPAEVDIAVAGDTTGAVFRLTRVATQLGAVNVQAQWVPPSMRDFESRRKQAIGRFLTDVELAKERNRDFSLVAMTKFPGLTTVVDSNGRRVLATARESGTGRCAVNVYLDGVELGAEYDDWVRTWDLAGVEFYSAPEVPVRYRSKAYGCGVFLLWSKWY